MNYTLGVDIGGTNTKIGLVSERGEVLNATSFPTDSDIAFDQFTVKLKQASLDIISDHSIVAVGIGCPNINARSGDIISPPNLGWGSINLLEPMQKIFNVPVYVSNDANIAAFGEKKWGAAQKHKDFIVVTLGTGVGTGIFVNNQILLGHNGLAGEGGHLRIQTNGRLCGCGERGHLECYASVRGIKETMKELTNKNLKFRQIAQMYQEGDAKAKKAFELTAKYLGKGLASMGSLFAPEAFILAGGVATIGENFRKDVTLYMNQYMFPPFKNNILVKTSEIATQNGAILGAASLAFQSIDCIQ